MTSEKRYCPNCGNMVETTSNFCYKCGFNLKIFFDNLSNLYAGDQKDLKFMDGCCRLYLGLDNPQVGDITESEDGILEIKGINPLKIEFTLPREEIEDCDIEYEEYIPEPPKEEFPDDEDCDFSNRCCFCGTYGSDDNDLVQVEEETCICEDCINKGRGL